MLTAGDIAPAINAKDQNGNTFSLAQFAGQKVALYFYPKDDTPGCTAQACNLRDNYSSLKTAGIQVVGVSTDTVASHKKFKGKFELPFPLLADDDHKIVNDYGVWVEKSMYGRKYMGTARTTFMIDEQGRIAKIIDKVKTADHSAQLLS